MWAHLEHSVNTPSWPTKMLEKLSKYSEFSYVNSGWYNKSGQSERHVNTDKSAVSFLLYKLKVTRALGSLVSGVKQTPRK